MEGIADAISDLREELGKFPDISGTLESIDATLDKLVDAMPTIPESDRQLELEEIVEYALLPYLREYEFADVTHSQTLHPLFDVISATTMDPDEGKPVMHDGVIFVRPYQWNLLRTTHYLELLRWFDKKGRQSEYIKKQGRDGGEPFYQHVFWQVEGVGTECKDSNVFTLSVGIKVDLSWSYYLGPHGCQAGMQHTKLDVDKPLGGDGIITCSQEHTKCDKCKRRLACRAHEQWIEKTICECQKNK